MKVSALRGKLTFSTVYGLLIICLWIFYSGKFTDIGSSTQALP